MIDAAVRALEGAGLRRPWRTPEEWEQFRRVWSHVFEGHTEREVADMAIAWLRSPDNTKGFWPTPGALLATRASSAEDAWSDVLRALPLGADKLCASLSVPDTAWQRVCDARAKLEAIRASGDRAALDRAERIAAMLPSGGEARVRAMVASVLACGGWRKLCRADDAQLSGHRRVFCDTFRVR